MKATKFSALAALILMAPVAQQAYALPPTTVFGASDVQLYLSGSSALQPVVGQFASDVCVAGTLDVYKDVTGSTLGGNWRSYSCTLDAAKTGLPTGTKMLLNNRNKGGSVWGVIPVSNGSPVAYMNINNGNCTNTSAGNWSCTVSALSSDITASGECGLTINPAATGDVVCRTSSAGISDVEPQMFVPPNLPSVSFTPNTTNYATFSGTQFSESGVIFGILATEHLYRDLQTAQGLVTYALATDPTDWSEAKRPSMKKTEIASILNGKFKNWRDANQTWITAGTTPGVFNGAMAICRRAAGSGTQAGAYAYFMENMCRTSSLRPGSLTMVGASASVGGYQVVENSSTGSLLTCLNSAYTGTNITQPAPGSANFAGVTHDAIGFAGIDILGGNPVRPTHVGANPDHFDFVKVDGVSPNVANAVNGDYTYWYENTLQWPNTASGFGPSGNNLVMLNLFQQDAASPGPINTIPLPGVAALPTAARLWDAPGNYPTMRGTRNGNSCQDVLLTKDNP